MSQDGWIAFFGLLLAGLTLVKALQERDQK